MIVVKKFKNEITMNKWVMNPTNIEELKKDYPTESYSANLNLMDKQVEVTKK